MSATISAPGVEIGPKVNRKNRAPKFWQSTNGKKVVMAVTGAIMFLFIIGHLLGNLLVFAGRPQLNAYSQFLHFDSSLLWIIRSVMIVSIVLHITATVQLALRNKRARPIGYSRREAINSSYASRTMY
jgi:succinate dehydrogenase / fumarate reductase cytochrome b subunit